MSEMDVQIKFDREGTLLVLIIRASSEEQAALFAKAIQNALAVCMVTAGPSDED